MTVAILKLCVILHLYYIEKTRLVKTEIFYTKLYVNLSKVELYICRSYLNLQWIYAINSINTEHRG